MNLRTLITRSLRFHWRSHVAVVLGAAVAAAVLVGALVVGDSVRYSLHRVALARLGKIEAALVAPDLFFRDALAKQVQNALDAPAASLILMTGVASREDGAARINHIQVLGVDREFWAMGGAAPLLADDAEEAAAVNDRTARRLGVKVGDTILVRVARPSALPLDAPLSGETDRTAAMRLTVKAIAGDNAFGRFSLAANQAAPYNVYLPAKWLGKQLGMTGRANALLLGPAKNVAQEGRGPYTPEMALRACWQPADAELTFKPLPKLMSVELRTSRVFLERPVGHSLLVGQYGEVGILTYFVNELRIGDRTTPYSMVSAIAGFPLGRPRGVPHTNPLVAEVAPDDMKDDEAVINAWLAEDLGAKVGDTLQMTYYVAGSGSRLETRSSRFRVRAIVPMNGPAGDRDLMPDFPGLAEAKNCRDWTPGVPIDLKKIRDKDQAYWDQYRGTPKAFVTLDAGRKMWANRWGDLTAVRFRGGADADQVRKLAKALMVDLDPASLGLFFQPVREQALAASGQAIDFGQLFLGLSVFLVAAALILTGLLFGFNADERAEETGTLLALGFPVRRVRRLMLAEGGALAVLGGLLGAAAGLLYTRIMLWALGTVWQGAVGGANLFFHVSPLTLAIGAAAGIVVALAVIWLTVRRQARAPARELLAAGAEAELRLPMAKRAGARLGIAVAAVASAGAAVILITLAGAMGEARAGVFFGAGALLLVAALGACQAVLVAIGGRWAGRRMTARGLALRSATRRRGRSLATVALVACGAFLVIAVGAFRPGAGEDAALPSSGTGRFALFGETAIPLYHSATSPEGRKAYGLPGDVASQIRVVPLKVHEGDDASCLNLNRVQRPRLVGVRPEALAQRGAFTFARTVEHPAGQNPWLLLKDRLAPDEVPAIADANTITWSLGKKVGDEVPYTDQRGRPFRLRLVGALAGSILQGSLVISEEAMTERFPSEGGYRMFLIDAPAAEAAEISAILSERLSDAGLAIMPATERLAEFNAVENTYLAIFQALGGLALVLGSAGLGVVVLRNVLERRGELALMRAVGFQAGLLARLVLTEHWALLVLGLAAGIVPALVAVAPAVRTAGTAFPYLSLGLTLAAVAVTGLAWTWLATRLALRGPLLAALRNE
jgi:ABC-type antimicrobial peptide transport system permease subunit